MVDLLNVDQSGRGDGFLDQQYAFVARLENVRVLSQLLKSIQIR